MISSDPVTFKLGRRKATMRVFRNNGYCWGRLNVGTEEYDVDVERDLYDESDEVAASALIYAAKLGKFDEALGWKGC